MRGEHELRDLMKTDCLPPTVRAFAAGDFALLADRFACSGYRAEVPARGVLHVRPADSVTLHPQLLLSVGVHGDETAPIEMLAQLLERLAGEPHVLAVDLMVVVGNPDAVAAGRRFVECDMNRLFFASPDGERTGTEARRAAEIMRVVSAFFVGTNAEKWHVDLHTAIRPSHYPKFAVIPDIIAPSRKRALLGWLGAAGIDAAICNRYPSATFSAWTAGRCDAISATLELGQVAAFGANELSRLEATSSALETFLCSGVPLSATEFPQGFTVVQELIKHSHAFRMAFDRDVWNFTPLQVGSLVAEDGDRVYRVGEKTEYVVFPNPDVQVGLRAGLMLVRDPSGVPVSDDAGN